MKLQDRQEIKIWTKATISKRRNHKILSSSPSSSSSLSSSMHRIDTTLIVCRILTNTVKLVSKRIRFQALDRILSYRVLTWLIRVSECVLFWLSSTTTMVHAITHTQTNVRTYLPTRLFQFYTGATSNSLWKILTYECTSTRTFVNTQKLGFVCFRRILADFVLHQSLGKWCKWIFDCARGRCVYAFVCVFVCVCVYVLRLTN